MNSSKLDHSLVVVKIKLFTISHTADTCKVFDNIGKKFVVLKKSALFLFLYCQSLFYRKQYFNFLEAIAEAVSLGCLQKGRVRMNNYVN